MFQEFHKQTLERLLQHPIVPVFHTDDEEYARQVVDACYAGGVRVVEFSNRGDNALPVFTYLREYVRQQYPDLTLGIGTVYTNQEAEIFIEAGADFVVQPVISATVAAICRHYDRLWMPGAMTINEIYQAMRMGATIIKVFPAHVVGPAYVKAVRGPLPKVKVMVTGGIEPTQESLRAWFGAGVNAVGIGSQLFNGSTELSSLTPRIVELLEYANNLVGESA
ncbi:beta/alpha barrel domain-containing protein [Hymenobacter rubidus]|uniref:bifunctional 4-hydroxy-2-oxoglutarate aldolase/2-dehydro-3-deoxy-phosphogluconate aldolase n=1 Tax=Hymenobacter rubidus TaxID=1441626 RepID=UPI00191F2370|nr:bifunctional 4-hydroxy-2-oxoglutarate aldolase/2-dehydro-3-deoxy-phosphogluconate aldolase [Hymenobacter rubidus]